MLHKERGLWAILFAHSHVTIFHGSEWTGVGHYSVEFLIGTQGSMLPRIVHDLTWNRTVNVNGGRGKCFPIDWCNKHFNCSSLECTGVTHYSLGFFIGTQGWMLPRIVHDLTWNRTVNVNGGRGKCFPIDRCNEHFICSSLECTEVTHYSLGFLIGTKGWMLPPHRPWLDMEPDCQCQQGQGKMHSNRLVQQAF